MIQAGFGAGGAEKVMAALAAHRATLGDEVHVAAMMMPEAGSFFAYPGSVRLHVMGPQRARGPLLQPRRAVDTGRLIRKLKPDLVVSFLTKVNCLTLIASAGTGVPVVISERNNPSAQSARVWRRLQKALMPRAAGIAMQTQDAADDLAPSQRDRARIIPNPCLPVDFSPAPPSETCRFVAVGRLTPQKGFDMLIDAFAALPRDLPATLDIFGQGGAHGALSQRIRDHGLEGRVRLAGLAPTARHWMSAGDVLVVSSRYEGFSNVLAEATCSGLPAIGFDCRYSVSEMIRHEENGLIVPDGDVMGLSQAMERISRNRELRRALGRSAHLMANRLKPAQIMSQWDELIDQAARQSPRVAPSQSAESAASS